MKKKVLVVDDDASFGRIIKMGLEDTFEIYLATSVKEGLGSFLNINPDVVVSDVHMPKVSGLDFLEFIKMLSPLTPVIMMTGNSSQALREEAIRAGTNDFLEKPFSLYKLKGIIKAVMTFNA